MNHPATDPPVSFHPVSVPDYLPPGPLGELQSRRLREVVARACEQSQPFRQRMHKQGLSPADVRGIEDIARLPLTTRDDLPDAATLAAATLPVRRMARFQGLGRPGTRPIMVPHTAHDLEVWTEALVRCLVSCGIDEGDTIQNACGHTLFAEGLAVQSAAERIGARVIPVAAGDTDHQIALLRDYGVSAICATPRWFLILAERAAEIGASLRDLPLRVGAFLAGPWSESMRRRIEEAAGIRACAVFGAGEVLGPGVGAECPRQSGLHVLEDHFYPEIVDPESGQPRADGEEGELVLTTLSREAMPLVRFRTGDWTAILAEPCPCGRSLRRLRSVGQRADDALVVEGVNVFPSQIEAAVLAVEGTVPDYQVVLTREEGRDRIELLVEVTPQILSDRVSAMEGVQTRLAQEIENSLGLRAVVRLVEPRSLRRGQREVVRIVDRRGE